jgi:hypothetical protein
MLRVSAGQPRVVHHDTAAGRAQRAHEESEDNLEAAHALSFGQCVIYPSRRTAHVAIAAHEPVRFDVFIEEQHRAVRTGRDGRGVLACAPQLVHGAREHTMPVRARE